MKSALLLALGCMAIQGSAFTPNPTHTKSRVAFSPTTSRLFGSPEPLATEGEWAAYLDEETTGVVYYFNSRTGESRWEPPTNTFPSAYLKPSRKRKAEAKREEYYKSMQKKEGKKGFLSSLLEPKEKEEKLEAEEEPEWMNSILEEKYPEEPEEKPGLFSRLLKAPAPEPTSSPPAAAPAVEATTSKEEPPKKGFLDNLFEQMVTEPAPAKSEPFFTEAEEDTSEKTARISEEKRVAEQKKAAAAKADAERKQKEEEKKATEQAKLKDQERKKAEEEAIMMERVRKAEAEQKAETERLEAEAKKAAEESIIVEEKPTPIKIDIGSCVLPHPSKMMWGGEDAVFTKGRTFGVFDGVSGADKMDGLPLYSKMLARQMMQLVGAGNDLTIKDLQDQLLTAAEIADERATGASTAVVASITEDGFLRAINLGDSSCIVVRGEKVVAKTKEIVHYFDCPYQLSEISPDRPRDARKMNFELLRGDTVVMGSDGIFDNLEDSEIVEIVTAEPVKANVIAKKVSDQSRKVSLNNKAPTPYSKQAKRNGDPDFRDGLGGKVDDISCVVVRYE